MLLAVVGKGGVGKTTLCALLLRRLVERGETPVLAVDADPSSCLGAALGIAVSRTLAELRDELRDDGGRPAGVSRPEQLTLLAEEAIVEQRGFDLLTMGHPEGKGCYCSVNNLIRDHLERLSRAYRHVLLDCEAGLEHLSRRTAGRPDLLVCVASRARMAAETVRRALTIFRALHGALPRVELVLNGFMPDEPLVDEARALAQLDGHPFDRVWVLPEDEALARCEATGRSLLELEGDSPALRALAGWEVAR
jgi:CO dehydrogenase maturation factor